MGDRSMPHRLTLKALNIPSRRDCPERRLIIAMLERAILDFFFDDHGRIQPSGYEANKKSARFWLTQEYFGSAVYWCEMFDLLPVLFKIRYLIDKEISGELQNNGSEVFTLNENGTIKSKISRPIKKRADDKGSPRKSDKAILSQGKRIYKPARKTSHSRTVSSSAYRLLQSGKIS